MDRVRIGIVGVGNIATLNVPGYLAHEQCDVVALCDPRRRRARAPARASGASTARYTDLDALLADDEIDAVEILSPTPLHAEHVIAAAARRQARVVQKPIANTVSRRAAHGRRPPTDAGVIFRVTEQACYYPPLRKARDLIASGDHRHPTVVRIKTVVGRTESEFQANLDPAGYSWRFNDQSPGGHLFDDVMHKYAMALWLVDEHVRSVQAIVRQGPLFFEAPTVALWEYARHDLLGMMEVSYAPDMFIRSDYYGADEFFEIQGTRGFVWVTRLCGNLHVDLPPLVLYEEDGRQSSFAELDASYDGSFRHAAAGVRRRRARGRDARPRRRRRASRRCSSRSRCTRRRTSGRAVDPERDRRVGDARTAGRPATRRCARDVEELFRTRGGPRGAAGTRVTAPGVVDWSASTPRSSSPPLAADRARRPTRHLPRRRARRRVPVRQPRARRRRRPHDLRRARARRSRWARCALAQRPPTERHTFGFERAEVLAAQANGVLLLVGAIAHRDRSDPPARESRRRSTRRAVLVVGVARTGRERRERGRARPRRARQPQPPRRVLAPRARRARARSR